MKKTLIEIDRRISKLHLKIIENLRFYHRILRVLKNILAVTILTALSCLIYAIFDTYSIFTHVQNPLEDSWLHKFLSIHFYTVEIIIIIITTIIHFARILIYRLVKPLVIMEIKIVMKYFTPQTNV